jgi:hypothetical protein
MSLYISINTPSASIAKSSIDEAISFFAAHAAIEKQQGRLPDGPSLDVTFMLPGEHEKPPFKGMRMGGYTQESDTLFFETAVPDHILKSSEAPRYVATVMQDVVFHAQEYFEEHKIKFDAHNWLMALSKLIDTDSSSTTTH